MAYRFLLLSARMGAGHDAVAAELAHRLARDGHRARRADVLDLLPAGIGAAVHAGYRGAIRHAPWTYAAVYRAFFRTGPTARPGSTPLAALAAPRLRALVDQQGADAVVPVFHLAAQLTGGLRARGTLLVPSVVVVTDFAVHRQWAHRGNDAYLCVCPEAAAEARRATDRPARAPGPVVPAAYFSPGGVAAARWRDRLADLGRGDGPPVLLSAGAWGAGSRVVPTADLLRRAGYLPVVLCGRNERLRRTAARVPGAVALGWVGDLAPLMAVCRALVDNAAGQTAVQALAAGLPVVSYRTIPGHGAEGAERMAELGLATPARTGWDLVAALDALTAPGPARRRRIHDGRALFTADTARLLVEEVRRSESEVRQPAARSGR